jgi:hypothetical protein
VYLGIKQTLIFRSRFKITGKKIIHVLGFRTIAFEHESMLDKLRHFITVFPIAFLLQLSPTATSATPLLA